MDEQLIKTILEMGWLEKRRKQDRDKYRLEPMQKTTIEMKPLVEDHKKWRMDWRIENKTPIKGHKE